ncbi:MAG: hypothetical protein LBK59_02005, partial [Bifidobacteriaceae bacterium]|nr:hypothetical protein [Bifidobacteriaceae bacterium]
MPPTATATIAKPCVGSAPTVRPAPTARPAPTKRAYLGTELVDAVERFPCRIDDDEDCEGQPVDLGTLVRLARTAKRGAMDFLIVDDTLAGNPP